MKTMQETGMVEQHVEPYGSRHRGQQDGSPESACVVCARPIYRTPLTADAPTEWRHKSSGRPLSYSPQQHIAKVVDMPKHAHKWTGRIGSVRACGVDQCDSAYISRSSKADREAEGPTG